MNDHQVKIGDARTVSVERNKGVIVRTEHILGRLVSPSPSIPLMLRSLILPAVLLASSKAFTSNAMFRNKSSLMIDRDQAPPPNLTVTLQWCASTATPNMRTDRLSYTRVCLSFTFRLSLEPKWFRFEWVSDEPVYCSLRRAQRCDLLNSQTFTTKAIPS